MATALRSEQPGRKRKGRKQVREESFHSSFQHHTPPGQRPDELCLERKNRVQPELGERLDTATRKETARLRGETQKLSERVGRRISSQRVLLLSQERLAP